LKNSPRDRQKKCLYVRCRTDFIHCGTYYSLSAIEIAFMHLVEMADAKLKWRLNSKARILWHPFKEEAAHVRCGSGFWSGQRPSLADYVIGTGQRRRRPSPESANVAHTLFNLTHNGRNRDD
jgi:hypothetical protein